MQGIFKMHLKWRDQPPKTTTFIYRLLYEKLMVTTNQKSILDTHTKKEKAVQNDIKNNHQVIRKQGEKRDLLKQIWNN